MHTKREQGFTLIELLVLVVIIGILLTLVGMTYSGVRAKNRNTQRETNINTLKGYLETYYAQNTKYPTLTNLNDANWRSQNLKDFDSKTLQDPQWSTSVKDCTADGKSVVSSKPDSKCYTYQVTTSDGSVCTNAADAMCAQYTLTATLEGGEKYVKSSLN
jgi:general secretion pathway protein G